MASDGCVHRASTIAVEALQCLRTGNQETHRATESKGRHADKDVRYATKVEHGWLGMSYVAGNTQHEEAEEQRMST